MNEEELVSILMKHNLHITTAESCTAGLISSTIVNVANASVVFDMAFVTYANEAKVKLLGVNDDNIKKYGVVSLEVAEEMANGAAKCAKAEIAISVSGIAGPTGDTKNKPIGMVCFGFYILGNVISEVKYFGNIGRNNVRMSTTKYAIDRCIALIKEKYND
jgi:nicotinamide-nucleotide amidase